MKHNESQIKYNESQMKHNESQTYVPENYCFPYPMNLKSFHIESQMIIYPK